METFFRKNDYHITDNYLNSGLIVFNACALTDANEKESLEIIETLKTYKPQGSQLIVGGCFPKINESKLKEAHDGIILYGEHDTTRLNDLIKAKHKLDGMSANFLHPRIKKLKRKPTNSKIFSSRIELLLDRKSESEYYGKISRILWAPLYYYDCWLNKNIHVPHRKQPTFFIKIATGCMQRCSYCAVKNSRGNLQSKPFEDIMKEFRSGLQQGNRHFGLLGTDLGPYGRDIGTDLISLLAIGRNDPSRR
jgi:tRNA A37 methylthiotransferase MiaB